MKLDGTNTFRAPVDTVWKTINDPEALRRCTPGLQVLKEIGPDTYEATLNIGIAAIKGTYVGTLRITDKEAPHHYKILLEGSGGAGFVKGEGLVDLEARGDETAIRWSGDIQVGGLIAGVGQRMLSGVGKMLIGQFFKCLEQQLAGGE
jgi:carbon monoxide dehydrogenase subunit G